MVPVVQAREIHYEAIVVAHRARVAGRARRADGLATPRVTKSSSAEPGPEKGDKKVTCRAILTPTPRTKPSRTGRRMHAVAASIASFAPVATSGARAPRRKSTGVAAARPTMPPPADKKRNVASVGVALVAAVSLNLAPAPALANVKYANDCDPICHVLDDGAAKSAKMEEDMKKGGADMGSALERLMAERKAEEAAAKGAKK